MHLEYYAFRIRTTVATAELPKGRQKMHTALQQPDHNILVVFEIVLCLRGLLSSACPGSHGMQPKSIGSERRQIQFVEDVAKVCKPAFRECNQNQWVKGAAKAKFSIMQPKSCVQCRRKMMLPESHMYINSAQSQRFQTWEQA